MVIFVAHKYDSPDDFSRACRVLRYLQSHDTDNCYVCPVIAFSPLRAARLEIETEMLIYEDLLEVCDVLLVASELDQKVRRQIALARQINMEVKYLEDRE